MDNYCVLAKADSEDSGRYVIVDGNIVEVFVESDDYNLFPKVELKWELGEVTLSPDYEELEVGDTAKIIKAQDNPLLSGLELVEGVELEVVLTVDSF